MAVTSFFWGSLATLLAGGLLPLAAGRNNRMAHRLGAGGRMASTGGSYAQLAQDGIYCSSIRPSLRQESKIALFPVRKLFHVHMGDHVLEHWFSPLFMQGAETAFRRLQAGWLKIYLTAIFLTTILLLCWNYTMVQD